ncbi:hypothetical protein BGZ99_005326 [Dissophora globulifera]|uniref:Uncharacterized protein n=1 Tax=Dissophora globulifera TaxID=979702 RepID=A0A9P6RJC1_9FUNG|nr:hypothetical protein BGZ99_005326 [Dissophora globulifera]
MRNPVRSTRRRGDTQSEGDNGDAQAVDGPTVREKEGRLNNNDDDDDESDGSGAYKPADNSDLETETRPSDSPATTTTKSTVSKKPKSAKVKLSKKRRRHSTEDNDNDHEDNNNNNNNNNNGDDGDRGGRKRRRRSEMEEFREFQREPILPVIDSMLSREQKAAAEIALLALDGRQDGETYRWPVREDLIPVVPSVTPEITNEPSAFEQYGMGFVDELTGVPKEEADYSDIDEDLLDRRSDALQGLSEAGLQERLLHRKRLNKRRKERQANERMSNSRLEQVHHFLESEVTLFARTQYRKGSRDRVKDLYKFQQETLPPFRIQAARAPIGSSRAGEEQEDELTTIQEKAVAFAAEDSLRKVLDRLPYVIRQGALGEAPDYVTLGLPKPVASAADYERGWDTMMAAASIAGIDDR